MKTYHKKNNKISPEGQGKEKMLTQGGKADCLHTCFQNHFNSFQTLGKAGVGGEGNQVNINLLEAPEP